MIHTQSIARFTKRQPTLQVINCPGDELISFNHYRSGSIRLVWHHHPELEIILILSGRGHHITGDSTGPYEAGELVFIGSNVPHARYSVPAPGENLEHICVQFRPDFLGSDFPKSACTAWLPALFKKAACGLRITGASHEISRRILLEMSGMAPEDRLLALLGLLRLWSTSTDLQPISHNYKPASGVAMVDAKLERVLQYIHENLDESIRQEHAARLVKMSPASFSRFFRRHARKTFVRMVNELRVGEAGRLLVETDAPITEIALAVGYQNLSNFNARFRAIRGMAPRDYRTVMQQMLSHSDPPAAKGRQAGSSAAAGTARRRN